jgi:hypothetical protein
MLCSWLLTGEHEKKDALPPKAEWGMLTPGIKHHYLLMRWKCRFEGY